MRNSKLLGLLVGLLGILFIVACGGGSEAAPTPTKAAAAPAATPTTASATESATSTGATGEVITVLHGENPYVFEPANLELKAGKAYTLDFSVPAEFHTFTVADLGIDVFINGGEKVTYNLTVDKIGEFELICVPHMTMGMVGTVKVS